MEAPPVPKRTYPGAIYAGAITPKHSVLAPRLLWILVLVLVARLSWKRLFSPWISIQWQRYLECMKYRRSILQKHAQQQQKCAYSIAAATTDNTTRDTTVRAVASLSSEIQQCATDLEEETRHHVHPYQRQLAMLHDWLQAAQRDVEFAYLPASIYPVPMPSFMDQEEDTDGTTAEQNMKLSAHLGWRDVTEKVRELRSEIRSLKGMLLRRRTFPLPR